MEPIIIGEIAKNKTEVIRVELNEYKEKKYLNIRVWYQNDKDEWLPTKKGIGIALEKYQDFKNLLEKADKVIGDLTN